MGAGIEHMLNLKNINIWMNLIGCLVQGIIPQKAKITKLLMFIYLFIHHFPLEQGLDKYLFCMDMNAYCLSSKCFYAPAILQSTGAQCQCLQRVSNLFTAGLT